ncbi:hypothetical protein [Cryobacterium sp. TMS1-13-1]|uniref:hypothetical protein n=1 Tax=Cryobacterium sp. TMS1-13-1 TaxID=1259220 RepID=UPI00106C9265|nr:hypothetical protein [Cryobacterium sp. TMS1-13-1]TFD20426.1 hypothetical protein E3T31_13885 [Cryobacterium sp. TMS1-13-1]
MAPDDDELGIAWLASQLGKPVGESSVESRADSTAASGPDEADAAALSPALLGRRVRRTAEAQAEPVTAIEPAPVAPAALAATVILPSSETDAVVQDPAASIRSQTGEDVVDQPTAPGAFDQPTELLPTPSTFGATGSGASGAAAATTVIARTAPAIEPPTASEPPSHHRSRRGTGGSRQASLVWTAVGLLAAIVLAGLFYLGQRLVASPVPVAAPTQSASPTPTPTPSPTPTPEITAMQPAGVHEWNTLFSGECLEPYVSPWEEDFMVVDCAASHTAQLVFRGDFGGDATTAFPGEAALAAQINLLCTSPGILDLSAAAAYPNLQMQGSYPVTAEQWIDEPRNFYCFASRASAEPLSMSIMGAGPGV